MLSAVRGLMIVIAFVASATTVWAVEDIPEITFTNEERLSDFNKADCCVFINKAIKEALPAETTIFDISENNDRVKLSNGPSFYKLFEIPPLKKKKIYRISSYVNKGEDGKSAFFPQVVLLDDGYKISYRSNHHEVFHTAADWWGTKEHLAINVLVKPSKSPQYMLIYTPVRYFSDLAFTKETDWASQKIDKLNIYTEMNVKSGDSVSRLKLLGLPSGKLKIKLRK